jgi:hypothetical protein
MRRRLIVAAECGGDAADDVAVSLCAGEQEGAFEGGKGQFGAGAGGAGVMSVPLEGVGEQLLPLVVGLGADVADRSGFGGQLEGGASGGASSVWLRKLPATS